MGIRGQACSLRCVCETQDSSLLSTAPVLCSSIQLRPKIYKKQETKLC